MFEQPSFPGFEVCPRHEIRFGPSGRSEVRHNLFFSLFPDREAAAGAHRLAERLREEHRLGSALLAARRLHVSLVGLGDYPSVQQKLVRLAFDAACGVAATAFDVSFDRVMTFGRRSGKRPTVLCCGNGPAELIDLREGLLAALGGLGLAFRTKSAFVPHVTLFYDNAAIAEQSVTPIRWTVREFVLVDSLRGRTLHVPLGRWRLRDRSLSHPT